MPLTKPKQTFGYVDLNIPWSENEFEVKKIVVKALELGYSTLALNISVHQKDLKVGNKGSKKKIKLERETIDFPEPPTMDLEVSDYSSFTKIKPQLLSRLTITFTNNDFLPYYNNSVTSKKYDLLSVIPETAVALTNLLKSGFKVDIIALSLEQGSTVKWSRKLYNECVNKFVFFEIPYSPSIFDSSKRQKLISLSHQYFAVGKSKNVILSSEALKAIHLRSPHDVANLGFLFGLNENLGKAAVRDMPFKAIESAMGRRLGPFRTTIQKIDGISESDSWKIPVIDSNTDDKDDNGHEIKKN